MIDQTGVGGGGGLFGKGSVKARKLCEAYATVRCAFVCACACVCVWGGGGACLFTTHTHTLFKVALKL